ELPLGCKGHDGDPVVTTDLVVFPGWRIGFRIEAVAPDDRAAEVVLGTGSTEKLRVTNTAPGQRRGFRRTTLLILIIGWVRGIAGLCGAYVVLRPAVVGSFVRGLEIWLGIDSGVPTVVVGR